MASNNLSQQQKQEHTETLADVLQRENRQIEDAALSIPHQFSTCTYHLGYLRQPVYLCKTCNIPRGLCAACSVACHHDHEQLELFPKRNFRCDCPTKAYSHPCSLIRDDPRPVNDRNSYNQNFRGGGQFCRCGRDYDPHTETETMIQCLACEDWYHESCLNLRERNFEPEAQQVEIEQGVPATEDDDADSDVDPTRPPPRLLASEYDTLVCRDCVLKIPVLKKLAGTPGLMMLISKEENISEPKVINWEMIGRPPESCSTNPVSQPEGTSVKRKQPDSSDTTEESQPKKQVKLEDGRVDASCQVVLPNEIAQQILRSIQTPSDQTLEYIGAGDVFLAPDFRDKWCQCSQCYASLAKHPYLLQEEETYEPPEDPDSSLSFEELGMRALNLLPRDRAIDGITAYNNFRDELLVYLRPFAQSGQAVSKDDIERFFSEKREERAAAARANSSRLAFMG